MGNSIYLLMVLLGLVSSAVISPEDYWHLRTGLLHEEEVTSIGGRVTLTEGERNASDLLMTHKRAEIDAAFSNPKKFLPAKNFLKDLGEIEQSEVFKIIKKLPKGAVLHAHDTAFVHWEFVYNITFRENLYICDRDEELSLQFFQTPLNTCDWKLLSDLRKDPAVADSLNERIRRKMTMLVENPDEKYPDIDAAWAKFMDIFMFITPMLTYRPVWQDHYYQGLKELYEDNVLYLELRSTLPALYELDGREYKPLEVVGIYKNVTARFKEDYPDFIGAKIIYAPLRMMSETEIGNFINEAVEMKRTYPHFFAGFDLVGQEDKGKTLKSYADKLNAGKNEINYFFHAGETNWYGTSTDDNLIDAVLLNTKRIGHGYAIVKHPKVLDYIKKNKIAIEICPISNQVLGLVKDLRNHLASALFADDVPVVVSNDDPGLFGSRALSYDFYEAFMGMMSKNADIRALKQLAMNSLIYSSLSQDEQFHAFNIWQGRWDRFINELNNEVI
ncbi:adenosine deaminase 2 [Diachasma alloeum]|uniref:adenosine deaminase 2 n=1 Tax=Diachasma alloeum TaxID=454923 RepID=UPI0007381988|nr:adenosine deaminase 2 [Diachasma alloeum]